LYRSCRQSKDQLDDALAAVAVFARGY
jgi:hypothetical protein